MSGPPGSVDGPFILFQNYDLPDNDSAYYPSLRGNVDALKAMVLEDPDSLFCGFNTNGWIKSCIRFDRSMLVPSSGSNFYMRAQYAGWHFVQGKDSPGNDIRRITEVSGANAIINRIAELWKDDDSNDSVAAFNTNGWVKRSIKFPLDSWPGAGPLEGFYIRTDFPDLNFFPGADSEGNDIRNVGSVNDIPSLVRACKADPTCAGFNTNGWLKKTISLPPSPEPSFKSPWQGTFLRTVWPDFVFLPGTDSPGNDIRQLTGQTLPALLQAARADSRVVALNTNGWLKSAVNKEPTPWPGSQGQTITQDGPNQFSGLYVKAAHVDSRTSLDLALFGLLSIGNAFALWFIKDANVRSEYSSAVKTASGEILSRVQSGIITPQEGAEQAIEMRNTLLKDMRSRTSRLGLTFAETIKPTGGTYETYLNKYAQQLYGKNYAELTVAEADEVALTAVESAGRARGSMTKLMKVLGTAGKALLVVSIACSVYSVAVADDWKAEVFTQVGWWSGAIVGGQVGVGVGAVFGPVGAVLGGIAGSVLGGIGFSSLATWFYGAITRRAAAEILLEVSLLEATRGHVQDRIRSSGKNFYVHRILTAHLELARSDGASASIALRMVETEATAQTTENVYATIVWIKSGQDVLPTNAANPKDMVTLLQWIAKNLPN